MKRWKGGGSRTARQALQTLRVTLPGMRRPDRQLWSRCGWEGPGTLPRSEQMSGIFTLKSSLCGWEMINSTMRNSESYRVMPSGREGPCERSWLRQLCGVQAHWSPFLPTLTGPGPCVSIEKSCGKKGTTLHSPTLRKVSRDNFQEIESLQGGGK